MIVSSVTAEVISQETDNALWNPRNTWKVKNIVIVRVESDIGRVGIGESWCEGGTPDAVISVIEKDYAPLVVGQDATEITSLWAKMYESSTMRGSSAISMAALSGIDIALWDLLGKVHDAPIHELLGGGGRQSVPTYASAGLYGTGKGANEVAEELAGYVGRGFRGVKMKVGGATLAEDLERVFAVRDAIGDNIALMVDAVYSYRATAAVQFIKETQSAGVKFYEAPVHPADLDGLAYVHRLTGAPIAGNEVAFGQAQFLSLIRTEAIAYIQFDCTLCGGITEGMRIASLARAFNIPCSLHSSSSAVCLSANLQVAAAIDNVDSVEYHMIHRLLFEGSGHGFEIDEAGRVETPLAPGLGLRQPPWAQ